MLKFSFYLFLLPLILSASSLGLDSQMLDIASQTFFNACGASTQADYKKIRNTSAMPESEASPIMKAIVEIQKDHSY